MEDRFIPKFSDEDLSTLHFTETQTAVLLGLSTATLRYWRQNEVGPQFKQLGRHVCYAWDDIEFWLEDSEEE